MPILIQFDGRVTNFG